MQPFGPVGTFSGSIDFKLILQEPMPSLSGALILLTYALHANDLNDLFSSLHFILNTGKVMKFSFSVLNAND